MKKSTQSAQIEGYDAHCHIFNLGFLTRAIVAIVVKEINKRNYRKDNLAKSAPEKKNEKIALKDKLTHLFELLCAVVHSEEKNFEFIQKSAKEAWNISVGAIPLMMDIYFILDNPVTSDIKKITYEAEPFLEHKKSNVSNREMESELKDILDHFGKKVKHFHRESKHLSEIELSIEKHIKEALQEKETHFMHKMLEYGSLQMSWGFKFHMRNLINMVGNYPVFPFFAADPRREGVIDAINNENFINNENGPFFGVKLYPRLGYHPASKPVQDILEACIKRDLPVLTHCGISGFPPKDFSFDGSGEWKYNDYGNPIHFKAAVEEGLRINFAHFGSGFDKQEEAKEWRETIVDFMQKNDKVYTDLSCYTEEEELQYVRDNYWNKIPEMQKRTMYGSDFDVMYFTNKEITLEDYCKQFDKVFGNALENMRWEIVNNFLK